MKTIIYHNPRCSKSREAKGLLEAENCEIEVVEYLKDTPDKSEIKKLVDLLGIAPHDLIRKGEAIYKEQYKGKELSDEQWIEAMAAHPILIERPIIIQGNKAVVGRPPSLVLDLVK
ncbi:MAG: arsenate reductase (glutaredoxin) [Bacteroidetes bacterium]|nr:MAG: arsenate reductase (glutaredoxin) [Bacteroidota bacterium]